MRIRNHTEKCEAEQTKPSIPLPLDDLQDPPLPGTRQHDHAPYLSLAVALLTGDDVGRAKELDSSDDQARASERRVRDGVLLGLIGRERVAVLYEPGVELPSDINGLVYTELDAAGGWKPKLASELNRTGIPVDWARLAQD